MSFQVGINTWNQLLSQRLAGGTSCSHTAELHYLPICCTSGEISSSSVQDAILDTHSHMTPSQYHFSSPVPTKRIRILKTGEGLRWAGCHLLFKVYGSTLPFYLLIFSRTTRLTSSAVGIPSVDETRWRQHLRPFTCSSRLEGSLCTFQKIISSHDSESLCVSLWKNVVLMGASTEDVLSIFDGVYLSLYLWTDFISVLTVQDAVTKLYRCELEIKMEAKVQVRAPEGV